MKILLLYSQILIFALASSTCAQSNIAPSNPSPDARYDSDVLLVLAHPDDETAIGSYLAKLVFDDQKRVSVVYTNRGSGGGNSIGNEQSTSLGLIREVEVHKALAEFGIYNMWILDGKDTPGQDVFHSLQNLNHGAALEKLVRIIRLTKPEVIFTWLPLYVSGENHGDHQAAGVIATEAFHMAGDPTIFPAQVAVPRERNDINNFNEGLLPCQPQKLYYFSDRKEPVTAEGPAFNIEDISPSKNVPYYELGIKLMKPHLVQGDVSEIAVKAEKSGDYSKVVSWLKNFNLVYGKSLVECSPTGDLFEGIRQTEIKYEPVAFQSAEIIDGVEFKLGGVFDFYSKFWSKYGIEHIAGFIEPEISVAAGSIMHVPLQIINNTGNSVEVKISIQKPDEWQEWAGSAIYKLKAGETYPVQTFLSVDWDAVGKTEYLIWTAEKEDQVINEIKVKIDVHEWVLPQ